MAVNQLQKEKIAARLWVEFMQCALRAGVAKVSMGDVRDVLTLTQELADADFYNQRRKRLKVVE